MLEPRDPEAVVATDTSPAPSRRAWLMGSAAIAAGLGGLARPSLAQDPVRPKEVLVLGAGMSGLTAALALLRRGHAVTMIEHQDRVGGRLLSLPLGGGMFTEAGGGHFRSNMPYVLSYVRQFGLPLLSLNDGLPRYLFDDQAGSAADMARWPWPLSPEERGVTVSSSLNRYLFRAGLDADTVLDARWADEDEIERLSNVTFGDLIRSVGASDAFCKLLNAHSGAGTCDGDALGGIPTRAYHFGDQNLFRIRGGNQRLPQAMAAAIGPDRIVLGEKVVGIDQTGAKVKVTTRGGREFLGDAVISTIPFSVLGEVEVRPGWSDRKARMIAGYEWDHTVKVVVKTRSPSWIGRGARGWPMAGGDRPWERVIDITGNEMGGHGSAFFYVNGANAQAYLAQPRETRAADLVRGFQSDLPDLFDEVLEIREFAWSEQPWIKASFGGPPIGGGWMFREWGIPEQRIHFAGDFTSLKSGWVEGAIEAGLRAAREIDPEARPEGRMRIRQEMRAR